MNPNLQTTKQPGFKLILLRKLSGAVTFSLITQSVILLIFLFSQHFCLLAPVDSFWSFLYALTTFSTWLYLLLFGAIIFMQNVICAKDYIVSPRYCSTRFQKFISIFSAHNVILLTLHNIMGVVCVWFYLLLADSDLANLIKYKDGVYYLAENTYFLLWSGFITGLYYFVTKYTSDRKIMFPIIQQIKWVELRWRLFPLLRESARCSFWPTIYFTGFYLLSQSLLVHQLAGLFNFKVNTEWSVMIYVYAWLFSTLIYYYLNVMMYCYQLFLTEPVEFSIIPQTADDFTLCDALSTDIPVIQHLACYDLYRLSGNSIGRREQIFTLSQPGGHPHNWNNLIETLLKVTNEYISMLNKSTIALMPEKLKNPHIIAPVETPTKQGINYDRLRNMTLQSDSFNISAARIPTSPAAVVKLQPSKLVIKFNSMIATLKTLFGIDYVFRELPEASIQRCLGDGQIIMWVVQSLSTLTSVSIKEDRYGIVQKDLAVIISTIVELKLSVEKLNRIPALNRRVQGGDDFNSKMKQAIVNSIRRALYQICSTFGPYLQEIHLKKEVLMQVQGFLTVKHDHVY